MRLFLLLISLCWICAASANSVHYIMDTDMGYDDWMAVLYLLKQPVPVDGITIDCQGETYCPQGAVNAAKLTHLAKRDVPITVGYITPPSHYNFPIAIRDFATNMHVKDFSKLKADHDVVSIPAAQWILNDVIQAAKNHYHVSIISIGTATNITDAWKLAQKNHQTKLFRSGLKMIYKGGGAFGKINHNALTDNNIDGNIPIPHLMKSNNKDAEWNIYANAPAMRTLVEANLPITFIPNNASDQVPMTQKVYNELRHNASKNNIADFNANAILSLCAPDNKWQKTQTGLDFWDTLATIVALHPQIITSTFKNVPIKIIIQKGNKYGSTWVTSHPKNDVTVDDHINSDAFYHFLLTGI